MNIEIANRLVNLRKENGLSQEQLAEKIGVSRQAVSKWERSEASPDTDNLIMLARLYQISLDELLRTEDEIPIPEPEEPSAPDPEEAEKAEEDTGEPEKPEEAANEEKASAEAEAGKKRDRVSIGPGGIHVSTEDGDEVHIGWGGIHVNDHSGQTVVVDENGAFVNGEEYNWQERAKERFPIYLICLLLFLGVGLTIPDGAGWRFSWIFLALIPIVLSAVTAVKKRDPGKFAYPVLAISLWLLTLAVSRPWNALFQWSWLGLLTIPLYSWICRRIRGKRPPSEEPAEKLHGLRGLLNQNADVTIDACVLILGIAAAITFRAGGHTAFPDLYRSGSYVIGALILLCIPVLTSLIRAVRERDPDRFAFGLLISGIYFGTAALNWPFAWEDSMHWILLTIPLYHWICGSLRDRRKKEVKTADQKETDGE